MKSRVLILWEEEYYDDLCRTMEKLISEKEYYLFSVVCGGQAPQPHSTGKRWAIEHGAPIEYLFEENPEILMRRLVNECDYLVMLLTDRTPQQQKQLMMRMKGAGKHGTVIKK